MQQTCTPQSTADGICNMIAQGATPVPDTGGGINGGDPDCPCATQCLPPNLINPQAGQCEPPETYKLTLTPNSATIEPGQRTTFTATVTKQDGSAPGKDVPVNISLKVDATSGGHDHGDSTRPRGSIDKTACESDATCKTFSIPAGSTTATFDFNATDAAGTHTVTASCDKCTNGEKSAKVDVMVKGLKPIPPSGFYALYETDGSVVGAVKGRHQSNHYLTANAANRLLLIAINYQIQQRFKVLNPATNKLAAPPVVHVNDASLMWGGRFDIKADWSAPHNEHMRGTVVDLRANEAAGAIPAELFKEFALLLKEVVKEGNRKFMPECTKDKVDKKGMPPSPKHKRSPANYCVSQLDGSQDSNRHYHVRLMGVEE